MATTNKGLLQPTEGSIDWNLPLNDNFGYIDTALGSTTTKSVTGVGTGAQVLLPAEYRSLSLRFTGTLTASVTYQIPSGVGGSWIVQNNAVDGAGGPYTLTIDNVAAGASVVVAKGASVTLYSDGTNIYEVGGGSSGSGTVTSVAVSGGTTGITTSGGPITGSGTITLAGTLAVANGGTGSVTESGARTALGLAIGTNVLAYDANLQSFVNTFTLPTADSTNGYVLKTNGAGTLSFGPATGGGGTVTSVGVSGGTTGLTTFGGPITGTGTITISGTLGIANGGTGGTTQATARTGLGLAIGTDVQAYSGSLQSISGVTAVTDRILYTTATNTYAATALTSFGRTLLDDGDAATMRTTLGLAIGADVLAYDSNLQSFVSTFTLPTTDSTAGYVLQTNGAGTLSFGPPGGGTLAIANGGTGATTAGAALTNLGAQAALGFTPVQQGGPIGTGSNKIYLGWNTNASGILAQVDTGGYLGRLIVNPVTTSTTPAPTALYAPGEMPLYACRAWGVCDADGNFVAGGNVAAISGLNPTTATFTVPMIDANYCVVVSGFGQEGNTRYPHIRGKAAGSVSFANGGGVAGGMWFAVFQ